MKFKPYEITKKNLFEILFVIATSLFIMFPSNGKLQKSSITYTHIHLAVLAISSIQTFFTIHYLPIFKKKCNQKLRKMNIHFRRLGFFKEKINQHFLKTITNPEYFYFIYIIKLLIVALDTHTTIFYRLYTFICYTSQGLTEVCIIILIRKLQEIVLKNLNGFHSLSGYSSKFIFFNFIDVILTVEMFNQKYKIKLDRCD